MRLFLTAIIGTFLAMPALADDPIRPMPRPEPEPSFVERQSAQCQLALDGQIEGDGLNCIIVGSAMELEDLKEGAAFLLIIAGDGVKDLSAKFDAWTATAADKLTD